MQGRKAGLYILIALIILAVVYGFIPKPVTVETAEVTRAYMRVDIEEEGKTRVADRFVVSAPVSGFALRIDLDVGDRVNKGQTITKLEPLRPSVLDPRSRAEAEARVSAAAASLNSAKENAVAAKARAVLTKKELERIITLFKDELVTQENLDKAETEASQSEAALRSAEFSVKVAEHQLEAARTALKYSAASSETRYQEKVIIKAPVDGSILKVNHKSEGVVSNGQALIEIGNPRNLEIEVDVLSADAVKIKPGTPVLFERWGGDYPLKGRVRNVEPAGFTKISALGVEEQRVLVISDIVSPHEEWSGLGDGYRVEASFILWEDDNVLQVPSSALFRHENGWAVFALSAGKAKLRIVELGNRNGLQAQIISGLSEGDTVITHPGNAVEDGVKVKLRN